MPPSEGLRKLVDTVTPQDCVGVEIGVYHADTSLHMLKKSKNLGYLYCIDPYIHRTPRYKKVDKQLSQFNNCTLLRMKSHAAVDKVPDDLDFVFIDGDHRYAIVLQDLYDWVPKLKPGGLLVGHDWCQWVEDAGVPKAGTEYFANHGDLFEPLLPNKRLKRMGLPYKIAGSGYIHKERNKRYPLWWRIKA